MKTIYLFSSKIRKRNQKNYKRKYFFRTGFFLLLHSNFIEICFENDMQTIYYRAIYQDNKFETTMFEYYFCGTTIIIDDIKNLTDKDVVNIFNDKREEVCYIKNKELLQAYDNLTSRLTSNKKIIFSIGKINFTN
ncbi:hypothetical protein HMPREF9466_01668 [Fusobacterium necrophorum subsp. funduliforme 1_1_36S]|nr:hypothetical protein HMPREF9466_01668 [Fusobacterium necrophorum subsp. funduliforme 1_1_36S]